jgi:DNA/RNA-binding domain of Phe-tRNA-synthetase-like protein
VNLPFDVRLALPGWDLYWARLEVAVGREPDSGSLRTAVAARVRARHRLETLASGPAVAAVRARFRAAGCDPTRYRPSSEALLRRVLKGEALPAIHPLVDLGNCLSLELAVPCGLLADGTFAGPITLRAGRGGEAYASLRGHFDLAGKPLLVDAEGPLDTPITGGERARVRPDTRSAWLVVYLPHGAVAPLTAERTLGVLLAESPLAVLAAAGAVGARREEPLAGGAGAAALQAEDAGG